jgi:hypothetical protein
MYNGPMNVQTLSLVPLGAGDLIDRTIRVYRKHFVTLIRISAPPVLLSAAGSMLWSLSIREMTRASSNFSLYAFVLLAGLGALTLMLGNLFFAVVLGGTARNIVSHLLWNEPVSVRTTYKNVRTKLWSLLGATLVIALVVLFAAGLVLTIWIFLFGLLAILSIQMDPQMNSAMVLLVFIPGLVLASIFSLWLFFWIAGKIAYVPQIIMVEGRPIFSAVFRSASLARKNTRRLAALVLFFSFTTYSALALIVIPISLVAYLHGIDFSIWNDEGRPVWLDICYNALFQVSSILLNPILMIGLSLLYIDDRVRREGYDIELMAINRLGPLPEISDGSEVPLTPALVTEEARRANPLSILE